jgi:2-keto-4-pentenoate hydratase/2-oxohepta-3-ene-1,7-dioic acid hydratase in catechol pathway
VKIVRFSLDGNNAVRTGIREGSSIRDVGDIDPLDVTEQTPAMATHALADVQLEVPLKRTPKIFALAGNYRKHADEAGLAVPTQGIVTPQIFSKPATTLLRHGGTVALRAKNVFFDWEAELGVIIGRTGRDIAESDAMQHVFGYTIINDLSERRFNSEIEGREKRHFDDFFDWLMGKWFDGSAPLGPELTTADEVADPDNLGIRLLLNGEVMQDSNTRHMIFKIPETIAAISSVITLERGDVIAMGTPEGVGFARGRALKAADCMQAEIEGLGQLETLVGECS